MLLILREIERKEKAVRKNSETLIEIANATMGELKSMYSDATTYIIKLASCFQHEADNVIQWLINV